ncbi:MAG: biotin synthase BioB [Proteobacteria bacterium]|nr:biotin synthase BioB [Pseudomonadota bacterium]
MKEILELKDRAITSRDLDFNDAIKLFEFGMSYPFLLMGLASEIREYFKGKKINLCGIVNAKSGRCGEDCKFCAQSVYHKTGVQTYPLLTADEIIEKAKEAKDSGAHMFGIVTSGTKISSEKEWNIIYEAVEGINKLGIKACASLGLLDEERAYELKRRGLYRYHHNLETSESFFPNICTTHEYREDIVTVLNAKKAGLSTCCGGIIGLGERIEHRIELAMTLRDLDVDSVPINILNPIKGTPLENLPPLTPIEILVTISIFRFLLPDKDIKLCGGKEKNLRQLLPLGIVAGCNSLMTGNYLTTTGRDTLLDLEMIKDLGMEAVFQEE